MAKCARLGSAPANGTAVTARAYIAIVENFQEADGSVSVPAVLEEFGAPRRVGAGA